MGRRAQVAFWLLVLSFGPVYPFLHLALVPHRFCLAHHSYERVKNHADPVAPPEPRNPEHPNDPEQHRPCLVANLTMLVASRAPEISIPLGVQPRAQQSICHPRCVVHRSPRELLASAPKASPPNGSA